MAKKKNISSYNKEYQGFIEQGTLKIARPEKGAKVLDTTTRADYKVANGVFDKRKIRLCVCGNQQVEGVHYKSGDLYAAVMKTSESETNGGHHSTILMQIAQDRH